MLRASEMTTAAKNADPYRPILQAIARLETKVLEIAKSQEGLKGELDTVVPRLDTLIAEVREAARLVHLQGDATQVLANETAEVLLTVSELEGRMCRLREAVGAAAEQPTGGAPKTSA